jgi:hypothetical protein
MQPKQVSTNQGRLKYKLAIATFETFWLRDFNVSKVPHDMGTQHDNIQHNDLQHNAIQDIGLICDNQHN